MGLRIFKDSGCTQEVTAGNPDTLNQAVTSGSAMTNAVSLWIKSDDSTLTYTGVTLDAIYDDDNPTAVNGKIDVTFAPDNAGSPGSYVQTLMLPDGTFSTAVRVWRKAYSPLVNAAFNRTDITLQLAYQEFKI